MLWKCCTQYAAKYGKLNSGHRTGKGQFSSQSQRKAMPKNVKMLHNCTHLTPGTFSSVRSLSHVQLRDPHGLQHARPPCPSPAPGVYSNSCPLSPWSIQPSHPLWSTSSPAFNLSQHQGLFQWVSSSHQVSKVLEFHSISPSNEYSGLISFRIDRLDLLQCKELSRVFSNITVQKHQLFSAQLSSQSNSHIHTWPLEKP